MTDLKQLYAAKCEELQVRRNSALYELLPTTASDLTELDLSMNVVGLKGLIPVLEVVAAAPSIKILNLADNQLSSQAATDIGRILKNHSSLQTLILNRNHLPLGGEALLELSKSNSALHAIDTSDTQIRSLFLKLIDYQLKKNKKGGAIVITPEEARDLAEAEAEYNTLTGFSFGGGFGAAQPDEDENSNHSEQEDSDDEFDEAEEQRMKEMMRLAAANNRRKTVSSEVISQRDMTTFEARVVSKSDADAVWLTKTLELHHLFSHLEDFELKIAINAMEPFSLKKGDEVLSEGDEGSKFMIIQQGAAEETKTDRDASRALAVGDCMGETDLLYSAPHTHTISVSSDDLQGFCLDRQTYRHIVTKSSAEKRERYVGFLQKVSFLKHMESHQLTQLADALKSSKFAKGDTIIEYGSEGQWFHIITEGTVEVIGRKDGKEVQVCTFTDGECVGELEFINKHMCVADVKALTPEVRTAKMQRKHFEKVMGPCVDLLKQVADTSEVFQYYRETQNQG